MNFVAMPTSNKLGFPVVNKGGENSGGEGKGFQDFLGSKTGKNDHLSFVSDRTRELTLSGARLSRIAVSAVTSEVNGSVDQPHNVQAGTQILPFEGGAVEGDGLVDSQASEGAVMPTTVASQNVETIVSDAAGNVDGTSDLQHVDIAVDDTTQPLPVPPYSGHVDQVASVTQLIQETPVPSPAAVPTQGAAAPAKVIDPVVSRQAQAPSNAVVADSEAEIEGEANLELPEGKQVQATATAPMVRKQVQGLTVTKPMIADTVDLAQAGKSIQTEFDVARAAVPESSSVPAKENFVSPRVVTGQVMEAVGRTFSRSGGKIEIQLTPEELGRVEVTIQKKDGMHVARVVVEKVETLDMIRTDIRNLEKALAQAGINVEAGSIGLELRENKDLPEESEKESGEGDFIGSKIVIGSAEKAVRRLSEGRGHFLNISV